MRFLLLCACWLSLCRWLIAADAPAGRRENAIAYPRLSGKTFYDGHRLAFDSTTTDADLVPLDQVEHLETLQLENTKITSAGVAKIRKFSDLRKLILGFTPLKNDDLKNVRGMALLEELELYETGITGGLQAIVGLAELRKLDLSRNHIGDAEMKYVASLPKLEVLILRDTEITDVGLLQLKSSISLKSLTLDRCHITSAGLKVVESLPSLESLSLNGTLIADDALELLKDHGKLKELNLANTAVGDRGLLFLKKLAALSSLDLGHTRVTDGAAATLGLFQELRTLNIESTAVTIEGVESILDLPHLQMLDVRDTSITVTEKLVGRLNVTVELQSFLVQDYQRGTWRMRDWQLRKGLHIWDGMMRLQSVLTVTRLMAYANLRLMICIVLGKDVENIGIFAFLSYA